MGYSELVLNLTLKELVIRMDMLLYKVSKTLQFIAEVNTTAGRIVIFSVPFATHAHGRGYISSDFPMRNSLKKTFYIW